MVTNITNTRIRYTEEAMRQEFLIKKTDVYDREKILNFYDAAVNAVESLKKIRDPYIESLYQHGVRPKSGTLNNPESYLSEDDKIHHAMKNFEFWPKDLKHNKPLPTLYDWLFERFFLDLQLMKELNQNELLGYIAILDQGAKDLETEVEMIGKKYNLTSQSDVSKCIRDLPEGAFYFSGRMTFIASKALSGMLKVILTQWYPDELN